MQPHWSLLFCAGMETALNKLIQQSQVEYHRQYQLQGKVVCVQLTQLKFPIYLLFNQQVQVMSQYDAKVDVKVTADAATLYKVSEGESLTELIKQDKLALEGELAVLQAFSQYLTDYPFDLAEFISQYIGDVPTHLLEKNIRQGKAWIADVLFATRDHFKQLTTEEYKLAPSKLEYLHFKDKLDDLTAAVERLEKNINQLSNKV